MTGRDACAAVPEAICTTRDQSRTLLYRTPRPERSAASQSGFFIYETCLLSFGLWLGTCYSKFFKKFRAIIFPRLPAVGCYLLWRVFFDEDED